MIQPWRGPVGGYVVDANWSWTKSRPRRWLRSSSMVAGTRNWPHGLLQLALSVIARRPDHTAIVSPGRTLHMTRFGLGALQLPLCARDNLAQIAEEVASAKRRMPWIDMIVVGELAAYGPSLAHAQPLPGTAERAFAAMARDNAVWLVNGSLYEEAEGRIYNTATAFAPDGSVVARHRKVYPFHPYEKGVEGGTDATVFEVPGVGRFGLLICYDIWFPELWRSAALQGAHVLINTVMTNTIDRDAELTLSRAAAITNQLYCESACNIDPVRG